MSFNVINLKHREAQDMWLHIKDADGELMYADDKKKNLYALSSNQFMAKYSAKRS